MPAELILLQGEPSYLAVQGAKELLWVNNTESDVFRMGLKGPVYYLVAGRWFSAPDFTGPWTFATPSLPADFKQIPLEHPRSRVLASVPGTAQAAEAILLAQIPQTARVSRTLQAPEVAYQGGTPSSSPSRRPPSQRAVNTDKDIFKIGDLYYMCFQGVWFMAKAPTGPWAVTAEVPKQIYEIPVSSPAHSVTYVTIQESNDDAVVYATAAAYTGAMVAWGCMVWGTGYYYPPYYGFYGGYPYYYGHYPTYGFGASYNPWTGAYTRGAACLWSLRRRRRGRPLQPAHRHVFAGRDGLRPVRRTGCGHGVQPAHRHLGRDAPRFERLRQLGIDRRATRRPMGHHFAGDQQPHRQHDARHRRERRRRSRHPQWRRRPDDGGPDRQRRRLCRPRRQRLQEGRRQLAEVRRRRLERRRATDAAAA